MSCCLCRETLSGDNAPTETYDGKPLCDKCASVLVEVREHGGKILNFRPREEGR